MLSLGASKAVLGFSSIVAWALPCFARGTSSHLIHDGQADGCRTILGHDFSGRVINEEDVELRIPFDEKERWSEPKACSCTLIE